MKKYLKPTHYFIILLLTCASCNFSNELSLENEKGVTLLSQIMTENLDVEKEVYTLKFSAKELSSGLETISYSYDFKDKIFEDNFIVLGNRFSDPIKYPYKTYKQFKIKDAPVTIIPEKYQEALTLLKENGLLEDNNTYYLASWVFKTNNNGKITADFKLTYFINTERTGRIQTTNYGEYSFIMKADQSLKLLD